MTDSGSPLTDQPRVAKAMGNGRVPIQKREQQLNNDMLELDLDDDGEADARAWIRTYANQKREPALIGFYRSVIHEDRPYVAVVFPYPVGYQLSILKVKNRSDRGITLTARDAGDPIAGDYFSKFDKTGQVEKARPFMLISQELDVYIHPQTGELQANHRFYGAWGINGVELRYHLTR